MPTKIVRTKDFIPKPLPNVDLFNEYYILSESEMDKQKPILISKFPEHQVIIMGGHGKRIYSCGHNDECFCLHPKEIIYLLDIKCRDCWLKDRGVIS